MSAAKSRKFFKKSALPDQEVTEREHELKLQMELAEQELKVTHPFHGYRHQSLNNFIQSLTMLQVQRRKMDEFQTLNETLVKELHKLEKKVTNFELKQK